MTRRLTSEPVNDRFVVLQIVGHHVRNLEKRLYDVIYATVGICSFTLMLLVVYTERVLRYSNLLMEFLDDLV